MPATDRVTITATITATPDLEPFSADDLADAMRATLHEVFPTADGYPVVPTVTVPAAVFVCVTDTYYRVVAVGATRDEATIAAARELQRTNNSGYGFEHTDPNPTPEQIAATYADGWQVYGPIPVGAAITE